MNVIITVTFNRPQIRELATCISKQTLKPDLWLIINNGGEDPNQYVCGKGVPYDIRTCTDTSSVPQACGWRYAASFVRPEWNVVLFDDDDYMPPTYFEERINDLKTAPMTYCDVRRYISLEEMKVREFRIGQHQYGITSNIAFRGDVASSLIASCNLAYARNSYSVDTYMTSRFAPEGIVRKTYNTMPVNIVKWGHGTVGSSQEHTRNNYVRDDAKIAQWLGDDLPRYQRYARGYTGDDAPLDIIIPLGTGSKSDNDELRILLRSIDANCSNVGRVIIATQQLPEWVQNVEHVYRADPLEHNKDGNIIDKVLCAIDHKNVHGRFVFCADDNVFMQPCDLTNLPMLYNGRGKDSFSDKGNPWHQRVRRTFELAEILGYPLEWNYECHAPQSFDADIISRNRNIVNYRINGGYSIYTLFHLLEGKHGGIPQNDYKQTIEKADKANAPLDRMLLSYNDNGFLGGLRKRLFEKFSQKCKYEK